MTPDETVSEFMARVCRFDLDGACELVTDDIEYDNVPLGKNYGPDGVKGLLGPMVDNLDEVDWVIHRQIADGSTVINERTDRFRMGGTWMELPVVGIFEVDGNGRISLWRDYFDMATFNEQLATLTGAQ
ncbi:MAG: limonene-1,2-epoxide hydrolase [Actinobacteria bacterium]|nr:MAG: limonene-1,2-epoxide hydrolase [Actinomycetota bacterium]RIK06753.1 MAG: limonene-1,2-epoxide hydrolase [Acidobacteriota bacterium]